MKDKSCSTLHLPNHNGGGAEPDFGVLFSDKISILAK